MSGGTDKWSIKEKTGGQIMAHINARNTLEMTFHMSVHIVNSRKRKLD